MRTEHHLAAGSAARAAAQHSGVVRCSCPDRRGDLRYGDGGYRIPEPSGCDREEARYYGDDVAWLTPIEVEAELAAITTVLATLRPAAHPIPYEWLEDRYAQLLAARYAAAMPTTAARADAGDVPPLPDWLARDLEAPWPDDGDEPPPPATRTTSRHRRIVTW